MVEEKQTLPDTEANSVANWIDDSSASSEQSEWSQLSDERIKGDVRWVKVYGWIVPTVAVVLAILFLLSIVFWSWHHLTPACWGWLEEGQLSKIQSVLFSGGLGAILATMIQRQFSRTDL